MTESRRAVMSIFASNVTNADWLTVRLPVAELQTLAIMAENGMAAFLPE